MLGHPKIVLDTNCLLHKQDDDDNKFVDCAFVCQADFIVTDDGHFDDAANSQFPLFRVMGLDEFAKRMKE